MELWQQLLVACIPGAVAAIIGVHMKGQFTELKEALLKEVRQGFVTQKEFDVTIKSFDRELEDLKDRIVERGRS